jgi:hypothetical protein
MDEISGPLFGNVLPWRDPPSRNACLDALLEIASELRKEHPSPGAIRVIMRFVLPHEPVDASQTAR